MPADPRTDPPTDGAPSAPADPHSGTTVPTTSGEARMIQTVGEFQLLRRLGKGGMAEVWLAEQTSLKRHVALKLLRRDLTEDATYVRRFETEGKAAAGLNHPNIVQVYAVGRDAGQHYIVQEYVQGQTLRTLLQRKGPLEVTVALHVMRQVAAALQAAAERGIIHRDIKPENIMITRKGEVKVADFGLAQLTQGEPLHLTQEGITMGTPLYMSPEQVKGKKLDQRSDIYSFGVTCYHMLAGRPPFEGETAVSVAVQHLQSDPEPLSALRPDLPKAVSELVHRMMARDPAARYQDPQSISVDVRRLLRAYREGADSQEVRLAELTLPSLPTPAEQAAGRRWRQALLAACAALAVASAGIGWLQRTPDLLRAAARTEPAMPRQNSAREQYLLAMFRLGGDNEDGWRAVIEHWEDQGDEPEWVVRAWEQLALLYLKDPHRSEDARAALHTIGSYRDQVADGDRCYAEMRLGLAALRAFAGDLGQARTILELDRPLFRTHLRGSWQQLYADVEQLVESAGQPLRDPS